MMNNLIDFEKTKKVFIIAEAGSNWKCGSYEEIDFAVNLVRTKGNNKIGLMQCTSKYPCPLEALNLGAIPEMKSRYNVPIGFSDHSMETIIAPILAVGLGATFIEKHFTLDNTTIF